MKNLLLINEMDKKETPLRGEPSEFPYREKILNKNEEVSSFVPPPLVEAPELDSRGGLQRKIS
jgi:hypothetical protein